MMTWFRGSPERVPRFRGPRVSWVLALVAIATSTQACLVLGLDRFYDEPSISFDERLLGNWRDADDNVTVTVERSDWRSYRIQYVHPTETGALTGYLFKQGSAIYLDLVAVRGKDFGSFVVPAHALVRVTFGTDPREVTVAPLSFDWFAKGPADPSLAASLRPIKGERDQILLGTTRVELQAWLKARPSPDPAFGPDAVFRKQ
jgi:hypothetical protein